MTDRGIELLLPALAERAEPRFDLFDVMHHGTHEKQLSNVFAWLLRADASHHLGDAFLGIFIAEVNASLPADQQVPLGEFSVRQEVNTSVAGEASDIADLVLESERTVLVVENYYTSDGHGHGYERYRAFGRRDGKMCTVVMLCDQYNPASLVDGWQDAPVVTYSALIERLMQHLGRTPDYASSYPEQRAFLQQLEQHFVTGGQMSADSTLEFVAAMCATGEAGLYGRRSDTVALTFADSVRQRALDQFNDSWEILRRIKAELKGYGAAVLVPQLNAELGDEVFAEVAANYQGNYQWTVTFAQVTEEESAEPAVQIKFGPSAWYANERDDYWAVTVPPNQADYRRLFVTRLDTKEIRQSQVTLQEAHEGLSADDHRLRDELLELLRER